MKTPKDKKKRPPQAPRRAWMVLLDSANAEPHVIHRRPNLRTR